MTYIITAWIQGSPTKILVTDFHHFKTEDHLGNEVNTNSFQGNHESQGMMSLVHILDSGCLMSIHNLAFICLGGKGRLQKVF